MKDWIKLIALFFVLGIIIFFLVILIYLKAAY